MKKFFVLGAEFLSFILAGLLLGFFLDKSFSLEGWGVLVCLLLVYILWFIKFFKKYL